MNLYITEHRGSRRRTPETKFTVSRWYIPSGYEYDKAVPVDIFFDTQEDAEAYAKIYRMPPEMAEVHTIAFHDEVIARCSKNYRDYKKRYWSDFADENRPKEFQS